MQLSDLIKVKEKERDKRNYKRKSQNLIKGHSHGPFL